MKWSYGYKGYVSTCNIEIMNTYNPGPQLKDTESAIRIRIKDLMSGVKGFKFVTALVLEFKK